MIDVKHVLNRQETYLHNYGGCLLYWNGLHSLKWISRLYCRRLRAWNGLSVQYLAAVLGNLHLVVNQVDLLELGNPSETGGLTVLRQLGVPCKAEVKFHLQK